MTASPGVAFLPCSYGYPIGLGISFGILKGTVSGDVAPSSSAILVCRGQGRPRQYILGVWIPFIRLRALLLLGALGLIWNGLKSLNPFGPTKSLTTLRLQIVVLKGAKRGNNQLLNSHLDVGKINCSYFIINKISLCCNLL